MRMHSPLAFLVGAITTYVASLPMEFGKTKYERELKKTACELESNQTLRAAFQKDVKLQYGISQNLNSNRYNLMRIDMSSSSKCYETCPNSSPLNITWCVHVYHPTENVTLCLNSKGIISETPTAAVLELQKQFVVKQCTQVPTSSVCLWTTNTPYYINRAYLVCTSQTTTCTSRSFVDNIVDASRARVEMTEFPTSPMSFVLGQTISLKCIATASSSISYIQWARDSSAFYPIRENPYCSTGNGCAVDTSPDAGSAKLKRVRMYVVYETSSLCGEDQMNMTSYLVIENATEADAGNYTCSAETILMFPNVKTSESLLLGVQ